MPAQPLLTAGAGALGLSWLAVPWQATAPRRIGALLLGPWIALVLLTQGGLFSDRSPALRMAIENEAVQAELRQDQIQASAGNPLDGAQHAQLILLALATPNTPDQLLTPGAVEPGQTVWIRRQELGDPKIWRIAVDAPALQGWVLAERLANPAGSPP